MAKIDAVLDALLAECGLQALAEPTRAWCRQEGASFVDELFEHIDAFAKALQLSVEHKQNLAAALARRVLPQVSEFMRVRNTFLDLVDGPRLIGLQRSRTEPQQGGRSSLDDSDEDLGLEPEIDEDGVGPAPGEVDEAPPASPAGLDLYKTVTCDGYEPTGEWGGWAREDPNLIPAPAAQPDVFMALEPGNIPEGMQFGGVAMPVMVGMCLVPVGRFDRPGEELATGPAAAPAAPEPRDPPRATGLQRVFSLASQTYRIRWTADSRILKTTNREHVSPIFELSFAGTAEFRLLMKPKSFHNQRGGASFKKSQGKGTVQLVCLTPVEDLVNPVITFRLAVGSGTDPRKQQRPRGPVQHDFRDRAICGLAESNDEWEFSRAVDKPTLSFVVCLELFPGAAPAR